MIKAKQLVEKETSCLFCPYCKKWIGLDAWKLEYEKTKKVKK